VAAVDEDDRGLPVRYAERPGHIADRASPVEIEDFAIEATRRRVAKSFTVIFMGA